MNPGDKISANEIELSWHNALKTFDLFIENGQRLRPIRFLIKYIIEKGYSRKLFAGTSLWNLLISIPTDMRLDFSKTLKISFDNLNQTIRFIYNSEIPRTEKSKWTEDCQPTEIIDIFEYFLQEHEDWKKIINTTR